MSSAIDDSDLIEPTDTSDERRPFGLDRRFPGLTTHDIAVSGLLLLILVVQIPAFFAWWHTPRLVLLTVAIPLGLFVWWTLVRERDRGAMIAALAVAWMLLAAIWSDNTVVSLKGYLAYDGTTLIVGATFALWALARRVSPDGVRFLIAVSLVGLGTQAGIAVLQQLVQVDDGMFALFARRSPGFTANPVYLGGLMAAAFTLTAHIVGRSRAIRWPVIGMVAFALALGLSGSRVALGAAIIASGPAVWNVRHDLTRAISIPTSLAIGQIASIVLSTSIGDGGSSTERLGETASSGGRLDHWSAALQALADRPIIGYGPTRFRAAVQDRVDVDYFRLAGADADIFYDAHNIIVGTLVAVGLIGGLLFGAFAIWSARRAHGPLAWAVLAIFITWLLQPTNIVTLSLAMLFLGAATSVGDGRDVGTPARAVSTAVAAPLILVGLALAAPIAIADVELEQASNRNDADAVASIGGFHSRDPIVTNLAVKIMWPEAADDPAREAQLFDLVERTIEYEDDLPLWWTERAGYSGFYRRYDDVEPSARRALELQPTDARAWSILLRYARDTDDAELEAEALAALCELGDENCDREAREP